MALFHINYFSNALKKMAGMNVVLPDGDGPHRVVYQLHGLSDDYSAWQRRTSIERYAGWYNLALVMPDGGRSFYTNAANGFGRYEDHILETVDFIDRTFNTVQGPEGRAIGGLSMGGYGAMKLGLKYPDLFGSIAAHSGALNMRRRLEADANLFPEVHGIYGSRLDPAEDCFALAEQPGVKPSIYFDCGVDDFLIEENRDFHAHLVKLGVEHVYEEFPGEHNWEYWDAHVPAALTFHLEAMAQAMGAK